MLIYWYIDMLMVTLTVMVMVMNRRGYCIQAPVEGGEVMRWVMAMMMLINMVMLIW